MECKYT